MSACEGCVRAEETGRQSNKQARYDVTGQSEGEDARIDAYAELVFASEGVLSVFEIKWVFDLSVVGGSFARYRFVPNRSNRCAKY